MYRKFLFITILLVAMLMGGVAYAEDGKCFCTKTTVNPLLILPNQEVTLDIKNEANCKAQEIVVSPNVKYGGCFWVPAAKPESKSSSGSTQSGNSAGTSASPLTTVDVTVVELENPLGKGRTDIREILGGIIKYAMGILGSLTLLVFVYGGFLWLISAGNPENVKKGSQTMLWAVIGIFIIFASYGILTLVFNAIGATKKADNPWGIGTVGGPKTQAEVVKQTEEWQCAPQSAFDENDPDKNTFDLDNECALASGPTGCVDKNSDEFNGVVVCEWKNAQCVKTMSEDDFCAKFLEKDDCETGVSGACKVIEK